MSELVARTGRHQQRYEDGYRLIAGCIPFKYRDVEDNAGGSPGKIVKVLMINSTSGPGLLFPKVGMVRELVLLGYSEMTYSMNSIAIKEWLLTVTNSKARGGWENDETAEEAAEREAMEEAGVRGDLVHFLGCYPFKSKTLQDEYSPEGLCRAAMYALHVKEELESWPEKSLRERSWLTIPEAIECCRHVWMREALEKGFSKWYADGMISTLPKNDFPNSSSDQH